MHRLIPALTGALAVGAVFASGALAAAPAPSSAPQIEGQADQPFVGDTLTATNGTWSGTPTSFTYQWNRCDALGDRKNCDSIPGATAKTYKLQKADVDHTINVKVTAKNADGTTTNDSKGTGIVSDAVAPKSFAKPSVTGDTTVGSTLTADPGEWAGATGFAFQWQQCDTGGNNCTDISGATGKSYNVRSGDVDHELRVQVTASNKYGSTAATSSFTKLVTATGGGGTTTVTTAGNRAPVINVLSLKVVANRVYVRFRVCDDSPGRLTVIARDLKARQLAYTRKFAVSTSTCSAYARRWVLIKRFRSPGKFVVSLRAQDKSGRLSRIVAASTRI